MAYVVDDLKTLKDFLYIYLLTPRATEVNSISSCLSSQTKAS